MNFTLHNLKNLQIVFSCQFKKKSCPPPNFVKFVSFVLLQFFFAIFFKSAAIHIKLDCTIFQTLDKSTKELFHHFKKSKCSHCIILLLSFNSVFLCSNTQFASRSSHPRCSVVWTTSCSRWAAGTSAASETRAGQSEKVAMRATESSWPCDIYIPLATWNPVGAQIRRFNLRCHLRSLFAFLPFLLLKVRYTSELSWCETGAWRCLPQSFRPSEPCPTSLLSLFLSPFFFLHLSPRYLCHPFASPLPPSNSIWPSLPPPSSSTSSPSSPHPPVQLPWRKCCQVKPC